MRETWKAKDVRVMETGDEEDVKVVKTWRC